MRRPDGHFSVLAYILFAVFAVFVMVLILLGLGVYGIFQNRDQSERNEEFITCLVAVGYETEDRVPKCDEPLQQLEDDGIIPPRDATGHRPRPGETPTTESTTIP